MLPLLLVQTDLPPIKKSNKTQNTHFFVLHKFHVYLVYDKVFSVHKHLTLNSNTQTQTELLPIEFVHGWNVIVHCSQHSCLYTLPIWRKNGDVRMQKRDVEAQTCQLWP